MTGTAFDLTGKKFGRLTVIEMAAEKMKSGEAKWVCRCDCGTSRLVPSYRLRSGRTKSCGCLAREQVASRNTKHGMFGTRIYRIWSGMMTRCTNENAINYADYGGRGIKVCDAWQQFENFYADMCDGYRDDLSLDRIDGDGDYRPDNCRWETATRQQRNRRNTVFIELNGRRQSLADWADETGIPAGTLSERLRRGWSAERALTTQIGQPRATPTHNAHP